MAAKAGNPETLVVVQPARPARRRSTGRRIAKRVASSAGRAAARAAAQERHTLAALGAAAVVGLAKRYDWDIPTLGDLPPTLAWGLGSWAVGRWGKNKMAQHVATGLLSIGLYEAIAYTKSTRDQIDELVRIQAEAEESERTTRGIMGDSHTRFDDED